MTFKEKKEIKNKTEKLSNEVFELIEKNKLAEDLWTLCNCSDNLTIVSENYENYYKAEKGFKKEEYEEELLDIRMEFYELFLNTVKKYNKGNKNDN